MSLLDTIRRQQQSKKEDWPPKQVRDHWEQVHGYRVRYRNDRLEMIRANPNLMFSEHKITTYIPVPWPRELARFSSSLLFSQSPTVINEKYEDIINRLLEVNDFGAFAVLGGVRVAAEGQGGIRVIRDSAISDDTPLITWVDEDQVIWDVRHGAFVAGGTVIITKKPDQDPQTVPSRVSQTGSAGDHVVFRLLEEHTPGMVRRRLFRGTEHTLGDPTRLTELEEFASLKDEEPTGLNKPTLVRWQNIPGGESDYFGLGSLFDAMNEAETTLLDRARKAIPRVFVDRSLADETGKLDIDGYILTGGTRLRPTLGKDPGQLINTVEPKFLSDEHIKWNDHLSQLIVSVAGYAPETWGIQGKTANVTRAVSGYAIKLAQLRTLLNRSVKQHMALQALGWAVAIATAWAADENDVSECLPVIELGDGMPDDPLDGAQEALWLRQAVAASTDQLVRSLHPTWDDTRVKIEVDRIFEEKVLAAGGDVPMADLDEDDPDAPAGTGREPSLPVV